ncbi:MAG: hypothetical protein AABY22_07500 [Nanoarchaeota archaeon]
MIEKDFSKSCYLRTDSGICGPEKKEKVPSKTIFINRRLDKVEKQRVLMHEKIHSLWVESHLNFNNDEQIELEALFHMRREWLTQAEYALLKYLSRGFTLHVTHLEELKKIRRRIVNFLRV